MKNKMRLIIEWGLTLYVGLTAGLTLSFLLLKLFRLAQSGNFYWGKIAGALATVSVLFVPVFLTVFFLLSLLDLKSIKTLRARAFMSMLATFSIYGAVVFFPPLEGFHQNIQW